MQTDLCSVGHDERTGIRITTSQILVTYTVRRMQQNWSQQKINRQVVHHRQMSHAINNKKFRKSTQIVDENNIPHILSRKSNNEKFMTKSNVEALNVVTAQQHNKCWPTHICVSNQKAIMVFQICPFNVRPKLSTG